MTDVSRSRERRGGRRRRLLSPVQKYEAFVQVLTGEMNVAECADHWGGDRSTIMRAREVAKRGALYALASSRPGVRSEGVDSELVIARDEVTRLGEAPGSPSGYGAASGSGRLFSLIGKTTFPHQPTL